MAANSQLTYGHLSGGAVREDVTDIIFQITPEDCPFYNMIGDSTATQPHHQWTTRALTTRAENAVQEGAEFAITDFHNLILPARVTNYTQILRKLPRVAETFQASETVGIGDLMADQIAQRSVEWKTDVEHALLRGSGFTGSSAAATVRSMDGYYNAIVGTANAADYDSQSSFNETMFNDLLEDLWISGGKCQDVLVNSKLKRKISSFTDSATKFFHSEDRRVINTIEVYESDFHLTSIHKSRDVRGTAPDIDLYAFDRSFFSKAWLRSPSVERLPKTGDAQTAVIIGELTLEYGNAEAAGLLHDIQISGV